tara:strand:- start:404 stop:1336 length:933 start_codon:yes stop_codon:yes gene_type:complete
MSEIKHFSEGYTKFFTEDFDDINPFDRLPCLNLLDRIYNTFTKVPYFKGGTFIIEDEEHYSNPKMKEVYERYNKDGIRPHNNKLICVYPWGHSPFAHKYDSIHIESYTGAKTCNYQVRDGAVFSPFQTLNLYDRHYKLLEDSLIEDDLLYFFIPSELIINYLKETNNGWDMKIPARFISQVKDWDDIYSIDKLIDNFDSKYENWNHDFPIWAFRSVLQKGLIMPSTNFYSTKILPYGTHRLFMCGECGYDYPVFTQIPKNTKKWELSTPTPTWKGTNGLSRLVVKIDLNCHEINFYLRDETSEKKIGVIK